ncbi:nibrin homolog isoform X2 [Cornus florida]|uniref:nibrin homolog isoform X2 n=1 Tax=Cornus florida TaxID=4283 RepID=UPI0028A25396|nr:nibrin homolog isoform X2 [Cornus florida]
MVWGLFPADPLSGDDKYYIFSKGTYKVGRKGCDVIINKDKGVSRIHSEIVVEGMASLDQLQNKPSKVSSSVRIRDCSKYGTFINKSQGSKEKVHEFPNKETTLKDGDLISFGTGNATYRFFVYHTKPFQVNQLLQDKISSIGAQITRIWSPEWTHFLVDQSMPLTEDVIDAIVAKKPVVLNKWIEFVAEKTICTEIPSCSSYAPTLMLEGLSVKVADPKSRENCLRGYTFLLESTAKYKFKDRLQLLFEMVGAKVVSAEEFCSSSQGLEDEENNQVVRVIPAGLVDKSECSIKLSTLHKVNEMNLICAVLTGHLDPSILISPPVVVSSSTSTDETVVADSDEEIETATSVHMSPNVHTSSTIHTFEGSKHESKGAEIETAKSVHTSPTVHILEGIKHESKGVSSMNHAAAGLETGHITCSRDRNDSITVKRDEIDESESGNLDIIYSQDLIVRDTNLPATVYSSTNSGAPNFKCFRKRRTQSGNSFSNLIPFSKYPYKDSDYGNEEVLESVKEEKKRKQMEAIAEDLFHNEKGKRRRAAGSIHGHFGLS